MLYEACVVALQGLTAHVRLWSWGCCIGLGGGLHLGLLYEASGFLCMACMFTYGQGVWVSCIRLGCLCVSMAPGDKSSGQMEESSLELTGAHSQGGWSLGVCGSIAERVGPWPEWF